MLLLHFQAGFCCALLITLLLQGRILTGTLDEPSEMLCEILPVPITTYSYTILWI